VAEGEFELRKVLGCVRIVGMHAIHFGMVQVHSPVYMAMSFAVDSTSIDLV